MNEQAQVFVDYTILSPMGKQRHTAGPFPEKDSVNFIEGLKKYYHSMTLLEVVTRPMPSQE